MAWFRKSNRPLDATDQLIDAVVQRLRQGQLAEAVSLLERSDHPDLRTQALSVRNQLQVLQHAHSFPQLQALTGSPESLLADYLETELPYLESFKSR